MIRTKLEAIAKPDEVVCDITYSQIGEGANGLPIYKTVFVNKPVHHQVIYIDPTSNLAIIKNLDYVEPTA